MADEPKPTTTNEDPAPKPEKKSPIIYSVRPKPDFKSFLEELIQEKGSAQLALEHCIRLAMNGSPAPALAPAPELHEILSDEERKQLDKICARNKIANHRQAISFSIKYTNKNQW